MSYHIYFLKDKNLNQDNINEYLESEISEGQPGYISSDERLKIANQIQSIGISFSELKDENKIQLNAESYEILFFNSMIGIGIPYWKENFETRIRTEIDSISELIIQNGFIIYDPQMEEFRSTAYDTYDFDELYETIIVESKSTYKISLFEKVKKWLGIKK